MSQKSVSIRSLDDPRIAPFRDLTHPQNRETPHHFVAEGENVTLRLLASDYRCPRVLCVDRKADQILPYLQSDTELITAPLELIQQIVGFKFHSGVMGLGLRKTVDTHLENALTDSQAGGNILVLPEITDPANLGALFRVAAAFGVRIVVLGERCRDPFVRQTVRTSMGTIFSLRLIQVKSSCESLQLLKDAGVTTFATVLDGDAEKLHQVDPVGRVALVLGNEGPGLDTRIIAGCAKKITIPMQLNTDSLNVVVACGIFLNHFCVSRE